MWPYNSWFIHRGTCNFCGTFPILWQKKKKKIRQITTETYSENNLTSLFLKNVKVMKYNKPLEDLLQIGEAVIRFLLLLQQITTNSVLKTTQMYYLTVFQAWSLTWLSLGWNEALVGPSSFLNVLDFSSFWRLPELPGFWSVSSMVKPGASHLSDLPSIFTSFSEHSCEWFSAFKGFMW